jgi:hypothetical protein
LLRIPDDRRIAEASSRGETLLEVDRSLAAGLRGLGESLMAQGSRL